MEKVTIQLEEVTVKLIDKMIEFKNENYDRDKIANIFLLASLRAKLTEIGEELYDENLQKETIEKLSELAPKEHRNACLKMVHDEIERLYFLFQLTDDKELKERLKKDMIKKLESIEIDNEKYQKSKENLLNKIKELQ